MWEAHPNSVELLMNWTPINLHPLKKNPALLVIMYVSICFKVENKPVAFAEKSFPNHRKLLMCDRSFIDMKVYGIEFKIIYHHCPPYEVMILV